MSNARWYCKKHQCEFGAGDCCFMCAAEINCTQSTATNNASRVILLDDVENIVKVELSGAVAMARSLSELSEGIIKRLRIQAKQQAVA